MVPRARAWLCVRRAAVGPLDRGARDRASEDRRGKSVQAPRKARWAGLARGGARGGGGGTWRTRGRRRDAQTLRRARRWTRQARRRVERGGDSAASDRSWRCARRGSGRTPGGCEARRERAPPGLARRASARGRDGDPPPTPSAGCGRAGPDVPLLSPRPRHAGRGPSPACAPSPRPDASPACQACGRGARPCRSPFRLWRCVCSFFFEFAMASAFLKFACVRCRAAGRAARLLGRAQVEGVGRAPCERAGWRHGARLVVAPGARPHLGATVACAERSRQSDRLDTRRNGRWERRAEEGRGREERRAGGGREGRGWRATGPTRRWWSAVGGIGPTPWSVLGWRSLSLGPRSPVFSFVLLASVVSSTDFRRFGRSKR